MKILHFFVMGEIVISRKTVVGRPSAMFSYDVVAMLVRSPRVDLDESVIVPVLILRWGGGVSNVHIRTRTVLFDWHLDQRSARVSPVHFVFILSDLMLLNALRLCGYLYHRSNSLAISSAGPGATALPYSQGGVFIRASL